MKRRSFLHKAGLAGLVPALLPKRVLGNAPPFGTIKNDPIAICTWNFKQANAAAGQALSEGKDALTAAILAAQVEEENPANSTVGYGGAPDRDGQVTLDACVMDHNGNCGAVLAVENVVHVASLARDVMEKTPHVMLSGKGAEAFAREQNYPNTPLLTPAAKAAWEEWKKTEQYQPIINIENHDTIGLLALDHEGRLAGGCTTSGVAYKMHGRVGDSPIIGAGLYVDGAVGGATATGLGEAVMRTVGSFLVVELMRQGASPQEACYEAVQRIIRCMPGDDLQVGYLALGRNGEVGGHAIHGGFNYAFHQRAEPEGIVQRVLIDASHG